MIEGTHKPESLTPICSASNYQHRRQQWGHNHKMNNYKKEKNSLLDTLFSDDFKPIYSLRMSGASFKKSMLNEKETTDQGRHTCSKKSRCYF